LPPGYESLAWVPNSSTLIYGERDAVLVDTFLTADATQALADWVMASGKNLTTIYLTHGHGDHFFGIGPLKHRFPHARAVARPDIVEAMRHEARSALLQQLLEFALSRPAPGTARGESAGWFTGREYGGTGSGTELVDAAKGLHRA